MFKKIIQFFKERAKKKALEKWAEDTFMGSDTKFIITQEKVNEDLFKNN